MIIAKIIACSFAALSMAGPLDSDRYRERMKAERTLEAMPLSSAPGVFLLKRFSAECREASSRWMERRSCVSRLLPDLAAVLYGDEVEAYQAFECNPYRFVSLARLVGVTDRGKFMFEIPPTAHHEIRDAFFILRDRALCSYCVRPCLMLR